jgi:hypothetical protein
VKEEEDPEQQSSRGDMRGNDDPPSKLKLNRHPGFSISQNSPLFPVGKEATITVQFAATCPISTGNVCDPNHVKLDRGTNNGAAYSGPAPNLSPKDQGEIDRLATEMISKASVQSLIINSPKQVKDDTFWSVTFQIR